VGPNTCDCSNTVRCLKRWLNLQGFTGSNCDVGICDPACQNGGVCVGPNCTIDDNS
jgi:hypothetical protein